MHSKTLTVNFFVHVAVAVALVATMLSGRMRVSAFSLLPNTQSIPVKARVSSVAPYKTPVSRRFTGYKYHGSNGGVSTGTSFWYERRSTGRTSSSSMGLVVASLLAFDSCVKASQSPSQSGPSYQSASTTSLAYCQGEDEDYVSLTEPPFHEDVLSYDHYNGVTLDLHNLIPSENFKTDLETALTFWRAEGRKGIWIHAPTSRAHLVPVGTCTCTRCCAFVSCILLP